MDRTRISVNKGYESKPCEFSFFFLLGGNRGPDESRQNQTCSGEAQRSKGEKGKTLVHTATVNSKENMNYGHDCKRRDI